MWFSMCGDREEVSSSEDELEGDELELEFEEEQRPMQIGPPGDVKHVTHVTFDKFKGFLGLPDDFQGHIARKVPSAGQTVFGVNPETMQCAYDDCGNSVPQILLELQRALYQQSGLEIEGIFRVAAANEQEDKVREQMNCGLVPPGIDPHALAGLIKAWFRELPSGVLDTLKPEELAKAETAEEMLTLVGQLPPMQSSLLDWVVNLMTDVVENEAKNKMNARNIAMVFAPNMTQVLDPILGLKHAVKVMELLRILIERKERDRAKAARALARQSMFDDSDYDTDREGLMAAALGSAGQDKKKQPQPQGQGQPNMELLHVSDYDTDRESSLRFSLQGQGVQDGDPGASGSMPPGAVPPGLGSIAEAAEAEGAPAAAAAREGAIPRGPWKTQLISMDEDSPTRVRHPPKVHARLYPRSPSDEGLRKTGSGSGSSTGSVTDKKGQGRELVRGVSDKERRGTGMGDEGREGRRGLRGLSADAKGYESMSPLQHTPGTPPDFVSPQPPAGKRPPSVSPARASGGGKGSGQGVRGKGGGSMNPEVESGEQLREGFPLALAEPSGSTWEQMALRDGQEGQGQEEGPCPSGEPLHGSAQVIETPDPSSRPRSSSGRGLAGKAGALDSSGVSVSKLPSPPRRAFAAMSPSREALVKPSGPPSFTFPILGEH